MKALYAVLVGLVVLVLSGCEGAPPESTTHAGMGYEVSKLFTHEDCSVYRFSDYGHVRYYTNCSGSTSYQTSSGKTTRPDGVMGGRL